MKLCAILILCLFITTSIATHPQFNEIPQCIADMTMKYKPRSEDAKALCRGECGPGDDIECSGVVYDKHASPCDAVHHKLGHKYKGKFVICGNSDVLSLPQKTCQITKHQVPLLECEVNVPDGSNLPHPCYYELTLPQFIILSQDISLQTAEIMSQGKFHANAKGLKRVIKNKKAAGRLRASADYIFVIVEDDDGEARIRFFDSKLKYRFGMTQLGNEVDG